MIKTFLFPPLTFRKDNQEEEEESNAISQFDAQIRLLEWKLLQAKMLASGEDDGEVGASLEGHGIRKECQETPSVAISAASADEAKIEIKSKISLLNV